MKRLFVVFGLLAMMLALRFLQADTGGGPDPLTLAAIGFVILASFAVAELLAKAGLPKVTGYIISGLVLGPNVANVLSSEVVEEMTMFKTLALGLIALTAGLELEVKALAKLAKTLLATVGAKVLIAAPLVGAALVAAELAFHPLGTQATGPALALGMIFAALSVGTSPAISLAIVSETGAKGRLSELVLGAAVLKDLVVVVVLAIAIAVAGSALSGGGIEGEVLVHVAKEIGGSIGAGLLLGFLLIAYLRWIQAEMLMFVAAMVLVVAELAKALHLELLLVFIVAGFVVRNFSEHEHDLLHPLEMVSLPVFVVFFTNAGAQVNIEATVKLLPLALLLFTVRAGGYWVAARLGNKLGGEQPAVADNAWYAYLPQAGVTLGLVGIAAAALEPIANEIETLGMAVVTLNLFAGPLALRTALGRAGELPKGEGESEGEAGAAGDEAEADAPSKVNRESTRDQVILDELDPRLQARVKTVAGELARTLEGQVRKQIDPWLELRRRAFAHLDATSPGAIVALAESPPRSDAIALANGLAVAFEAGANHLQRLEVGDTVALERRWLEPARNEGAAAKTRRILRKIAVAIGSRRAARRELPLRLIAREAFEPRLATALLELFRHSCHTDARLAELLRKRLSDGLDAEDLPAAIDAVLEDFGATAKSILSSTLTAGSRRMHQLLARIDSPATPLSHLDFSEAAAGIERELEALLAEAELWPPVVDACWQTVAVTARIRSLDTRLAEGRKVGADIDQAKLAIEEELAGFQRRLQELREAVDQGAAAGELDADALATLQTRCRGLLPKPATRRLRQVELKLRRSSASRQIRQALREAFSREAGSKVLAATELVAHAEIPARIRLREVDVRELVDGEVAGRLIPRTEREIDTAAKLVAETAQATQAMVGDVELLLELYRGREENTGVANLRLGLEKVSQRLTQLGAEEAGKLDQAARGIEEEFDQLDARLSAALDEATGASEAARWVSRQRSLARQQFGRSLLEARERATTLWHKLRERGDALLTALDRDYRLRSGLTLPSATTIAELLRAQDTLPLPREYRTLFDEQPVRDPRFFLVNREPLRRVTRAERGWLQGEAGNAVLVVGGPGSGKTSLLNVASLKLGTRELIWPSAESGRVGLLAALAGELRCEVDEATILRRLCDRQRAIVIDDLERLLPVGGAALDELELLLRLVAETKASCFWLLAVGRSLQRLVEPLSPLRVGLAEVVELGRLEAGELANMLLSRHRISNVELVFPQHPVRKLLARLPFIEAKPQTSEKAYFAALEDIAAGNLRAAMFEWCRRATHDEEQMILARGMRARNLPFVRQLPPTALALLALIVEFGPSTPEALAAALTCEPAQLQRWIHFLATAGLLIRDDSERLRCPPRVRDVLVPELINLAVIPPGTAPVSVALPTSTR